jgi:hypothetical protein
MAGIHERGRAQSEVPGHLPSTEGKQMPNHHIPASAGCGLGGLLQ